MAQDAVGSCMATLEKNFHAGVAPDGTTVISTPFRYVSGDAVEIALWQESGRSYIGDRGRLLEALSLVGLDPLENDHSLARMNSISSRHGAHLDQGIVVVPVGNDLGNAMRSLLQTVMDLQTVGYEEHKELGPEPLAYDLIRDVLHRHETPYRERTDIGGFLGRRYSVDFLFAVTTDAKPVRALVVVATKHQTLYFAERWNFRFRDIHQKHPKLRRIVVVDQEARWSDAADRTVRPECDGVLQASPGAELTDFVDDIALGAHLS